MKVNKHIRNDFRKLFKTKFVRYFSSLIFLLACSIANSQSFDLKKYIESLPTIKTPFISVDQNKRTTNNEKPLSIIQLETLSINKIDLFNSYVNEEKEVSISSKFELNGDYLLWAKIYALGIKEGAYVSVLISYDRNYKYVGYIQFSGYCEAQCNCIIHSIVYDDLVKNITFSNCPNEDSLEERIIGDFNKYKINKDGTFTLIQSGISSQEQFNDYVSKIYALKNRKIGAIEDKDGYTNIRSAQNSTSKIIGKVINNQNFYYWEDTNQNWWFVENKDGIEGYMHKSRIKK